MVIFVCVSLFVFSFSLAGQFMSDVSFKKERIYTTLYVSELEDPELRLRNGQNLKLLVYNGTYPGPEIRIPKHKILVVTVYNMASVPTTIHWHGMFLNRKPWFDGVPGVTQCPIEPGESFTYEVDPNNQLGTFWYHSHYQGQYIDGLVGPLIVDDLEPPFEYDGEITLMVSDWYRHNNSTELLEFVKAINSTNTEPLPDTVLINGKQNNTEFHIIQGSYVRIRIICSGAVGAFNISFTDGTSFDVIELDGTYINKIRVKSFFIAVAQRVSILVKFRTSSLLMATLVMPLDNQPPTPLFATSRFTVHKVKRHSVEGINETETHDALYDADLDGIARPLYAEEAPEPVQYRVSFNLTIDFDVNFVIRGFLNGESLIVEILEKKLLLSNLSDPKNEYETSQLHNSNYHPFVFTHSEGVVEILVNNFDGGDHPFHLHGNIFYVLGSGRGVYNGRQYLNLVNPIRRDTVIIPAEGWVILRFRLNNVGIWLCMFYVNNSSLPYRVA